MGTEKQKENCNSSSDLFHKSYIPRDTDIIQTAKETKNFACKKLINILDVIAVDKKDAEYILSTVDPHEMKVVTEIRANVDTDNLNETTEIEQVYYAIPILGCSEQTDR